MIVRGCERDALPVTSSIAVAKPSPPFRASNRHTISIKLVILVIAALAGAKVGKVAHELDRRDPLDHLEA